MTEYLLQIGGLWLLMLYIYSHYPEIIDIMKVLRKIYPTISGIWFFPLFFWRAGGREGDRLNEPLNIL